jgi:hypothetical protein
MKVLINEGHTETYGHVIQPLSLGSTNQNSRKNEINKERRKKTIKEENLKCWR